MEQDRAHAVKWFWSAATAGQSWGQHNLAVAYHDGRGVERDTTEAIRWYLMAAEQGFTISQIAIGVMYFAGDDIEEDDDEAEERFRMAANEGDPPAVRDRGDDGRLRPSGVEGG